MTNTITYAPTLTDDTIIGRALAILQSRMREPGDTLASPRAVRDWLRLKLGERPHEMFVVLLLDTQNRLIAAEELFRGTLSQTSVHPREVIKLALAHNAAGAILAHNHPSGVTEPSRADEYITKTLQQALALVEIKLLDHFIVAGAAEPLSFAERGLI